MAVFITRNGYIKRISLDTFERQNRATRGKGGIKTRDNDDVEHFFTATMHNKVLFFTDKGLVYSVNVYDFPEGGRTAKGLPIINLLPVSQDEHVTAVIPITELSKNQYLLLLTKKGFIKKIELDNFSSIRRSGIIAIGLADDDLLGWVKLAKKMMKLLIGTSRGCNRIPVAEMRPLGGVPEV